MAGSGQAECIREGGQNHAMLGLIKGAGKPCLQPMHRIRFYGFATAYA